MNWRVGLAVVPLLASANQCDRLEALKTRQTPTATTTNAPQPSSAPTQFHAQAGAPLTFFVTADTHFGYRMPDHTASLPIPSQVGIEKRNEAALTAMNTIHERKWPGGGTLGRPRFVLVAGDLTENGTEASWKRFVGHFGLLGGDALLKYPVFETIGNHDKHRGFGIKEHVRERHGDIRYTISTEAVELFCLGEAPDNEDLEWLAKGLAKLPAGKAVMLYMHFPLKGPHSDNQWFGKGPYRERLRQVIANYNIEAIFHGHAHNSLHYQWHGVDVYNVGSPKHAYHDFGVVKRTAKELVVAAYNYDLKAFTWSHRKPTTTTH